MAKDVVVIPESLMLLNDLLDRLGYRWTNHYHQPTNQEAKWCLVSKTSGHAGRVGMTEQEALVHLLRLAAVKIEQLERTQYQVSEDCKSALRRMGTEI